MNIKDDTTIIETLSEDSRADVALILRVKGGDAAAFEHTYYRWYRPLYGFMFKVTRSRSDSEDITQEVFARFWTMRHTLDPHKSVQALLFTIALRIAIDMYRRKGKISKVPQGEPEKERSTEPTPQEIMEEQETAILLNIAIESMPDKQRKIFSMHYFENMSPKEIALQTGLSYDNVRKHIYNGKRHLQEIVTCVMVFLL